MELRRREVLQMACFIPVNSFFEICLYDVLKSLIGK